MVRVDSQHPCTLMMPLPGNTATVQQLQGNPGRRCAMAVASGPAGRPECGVCWCARALGWNDPRMDMLTRGLMATVVGAGAVGVAGVAKSAADNLLPGMAEKTNHRHQMRIHLHSQHCEALQQWRAGLAEARDAYRRGGCGP